MKKKIVLLFATVIVFAVLFLVYGKLHSRSKDTIIVAVDEASFPPMCFVNKEEITGFDVDLAKEAGKRMSLSVIFKPINWSQKTEYLDKGKVDCVWSGLEITAERKKQILYSKPYMCTRHLLFVPVSSDIKKLSELKGWQIGIQKGTAVKEITDSDPAFHNGMRVKEFDSFEDAFRNMADGGVVGVLVPEITGRYYMTKHKGECYPLEDQYGPASHFAVGFNKNNTELCDKVQKVLDEITADGTAAKISEKWFGKDLMIKQ